MLNLSSEPKGSAGPPPPPPPAIQPPDDAGSKPAGTDAKRADLFASINKGGNVTQGIRKNPP